MSRNEQPFHIGLTGRAQAGKDTAAAALTDLGWVRIAFADGVRDMAYAIDPLVQIGGITRRLASVVEARGWDAAKQHPDVRRFLQRLGTDGVRNHLGDHQWIDLAMRKATGPTVFTDIRFPNEADAVKAAGGIIVRITRLDLADIPAHVSETAMDNYPVDTEILNAGAPADLHAAIRGLLP